MLSVNIPVYNTEVSSLVREIIRQAVNENIDFEIRVYDDGSDAEFILKNKVLASLPSVVYKEMPANLGRSAIRNKMGAESQHDYLLFIDADSRIISEDYIQSYIKCATPGCVLCGGTAYSFENPADTGKMLRWVYGRKREAISAGERNKSKGFIITSNNFLIDRKVFLSTRFRENIGPYGHEDTLLGYDLFKKGIHPFHIDNPVEHTGLENSKLFILKTRKALENLLYISEELLQSESDFEMRVKFLNRYRKLTAVCPPVILRQFYKFMRGYIETNLTGRNPSLLWFDIYKVCFFAGLKKKK